MGKVLDHRLDPFLVSFGIGAFLEGSENGRIFGSALWCRRATFELVFGSVQSGRGVIISRCIWITPKCSQLLLVLNTHSFYSIKLKLAAFFPAQRQQGRFLVVHRFLKNFSVSKMESNRTKAGPPWACRRVQIEPFWPILWPNLWPEFQANF